MGTWILSAHRAGACLYEQAVKGAALETLITIDHPEGRLRDRQLNSDRFGRAFDSHGHGRRAMAPSERPTERIAADFARTLTEDLNTARAAGCFDHLIIVAEPTMLGLLRSQLDDATSKHLQHTLDKEFRADELDKLCQALSDHEYLELPGS